MNPSLDRIAKLLRSTRTIAVVGYSAKPQRPSHRIAAYLKEQGYRVFPVNPGLKTALDGPCYARLSDVPGAIDLVDIFRSPEHVPAVVDEAIAKKAKIVWMQEGAENPEAAKTARDAGLTAVVGRCIYRDHAALVGPEE